MTDAIRIALFTVMFWLLGLTNVWAHNVIGAVYVIGDEIEGELGFSNGDMAPAGTPVTISSADNVIVAELETDAEGFFVYKAARRMDFKFHADLGSGHVFDALLPADDLPLTLPVDLPTENGARAQNNKMQKHQLPSDGSLTLTNSALSTPDKVELNAMIQKAVAKQIKPLRKAIQAYQAKASFQDILGGIGYIFGLCGLAIWYRQRKDNNGQNNETSA